LNNQDKKNKAVLKEDEIRPEHLKERHAKIFSNDLRWLLQFKNQFVYVNCPACNSTSYVDMFQKQEINYVTCSNCETMYINPRPNAELLENYYLESENYKYWKKYIFLSSEDIRRDKIFRPRVERIENFCRKYKIKKDVLLEVGPGFGTFCAEVQKRRLFKKVIGVESKPDLAQKCRERGIEIIEKPVEKVKLESETINIIASFGVIEYLFSPRDFVSSCAALLSKGGLLVLACPNCKGFDIAVLGELSETVTHEHLNYFNPSSLSNMISEYGLDVLEVSTPGKLDAELVRKSIISGKFNISERPFLKEILIDKWDRLGSFFQKFLENNGLSSHMWVVARKT